MRVIETNDKTTVAFIVGAGASVPFGMPTGGQLKTQIIELIDASLTTSHVGRPHLTETTIGVIRAFDLEERKKFKVAFLGSSMFSIDAFLEGRPEFTELGKTAIAACLLSAERSALAEMIKNGDWLGYMFNSLQISKYPELLQQLNFVTFNYDRLLEHFLMSSIHYATGIPWVDMKDIAAHLHVTHVHGSLGSYEPWSDPDHPLLLPDKELTGLDIELSASKITLVHEDGADEIQDTAKKAIAHSDRIVVMGLGYSPDNLHKLFSNCQSHEATLVGTNLGLTKIEVQAAIDLINHQEMSPNLKVELQHNFTYSCEKLLKNTAILRGLS